MENFRGIPIEFKLNGLQIVPQNKQEKYSGRHYLIYETNIPEFFIKIFRHKSTDVNELFKNSSLAMTTELDKSDMSPLKIMMTIQNPDPVFWGLLIESFPLSFQEMVSLSSHAYDFDVFRFAMQMGCYLNQFENRDLQLMHLNEDNIVMDNSGNFQMANLDHSVSIFKRSGENGKQYLKEYVEYVKVHRRDSPLAPEVVSDMDFGIESLVWDLGVLLTKVFIGIYPQVDYRGKSVVINFEVKYKLNESRKTIISLIESCLKFRKSERISVPDILKTCKRALEQIPSLLNWIHTNFISSESPTILGSCDKIYNMVHTKKFRSDKGLKSVGPKKQQKSYQGLPAKALIKIILQSSPYMMDEAIRELIKLEWNQPNSIVEVYMHIKERIDKLMNSEVRSMKLMLFLYAYISMGSQNSLLVNDKTNGAYREQQSSKLDPSQSRKLSQSSNNNAISFFLEKILEIYQNKSQNLIYQFSYFVMVKFHLHLSIGNSIDNNFALNKAQIILNYKKVLDPELFLITYKYLSFVFQFFISIRKYTFDYFQKYTLITLYKEIQAVLGLLCNLLSMLQFGLGAFDPSDGPLNSDKIRALEDVLKHILANFEVVASGLNLFAIQSVKRGFTVMSALKIRKKLGEIYSNNQKRIIKELADKDKFSFRLFTKFFLNTLVRMQDPNKSEKVPKQTQTPAEEAAQLRRDFAGILNSFYDIKSDLSAIDLHLAKVIPKARFWYEHQFRSQNKMYHQNNEKVNQILTSVLLERNQKLKRDGGSQRSRSSKVGSRFKRNGSRHRSPISKRNIAVQVNLLEKELKKLNANANARNDRHSRKVDQKILISKSLTQSINEKAKGKIDNILSKKDITKSNLIKSEVGDVYYKTFNVNKFLAKEFKASLKAWVIPYERLKFKKEIGSGSTCWVYKGTYMNIPVAIKKLKKDNKVDEMVDQSGVQKPKAHKFLKEFKREIGLLITLPNHPNLLTILGFNIHEGFVHIVTEFCHGGTIFDILYKKAHRVKLSFQQQLKILMDICRGMMFLHSLDNQIIHRDLKSLNIFISNKIRENSLDFQIKIADFGLARSFENEQEFVTKRMGTFHWMAPEIFSDFPYSTKTDVYAFAIIMWEVFAGRTPYYDLGKPEKIIKYVYYEDKRPSLRDCKIPTPYEERIKKIISTNWQRTSENRQEFSEIYDSLDEIWKYL